MSVTGSVLGEVFTSGPLEWQYVEVFFLHAGTVVAVPHDLTGTFVGWTPVRKRGYGDIKDGPSQPGGSVLQLVSNTAKLSALIRVEAVRIPRR